jgi:indole-3-pyruvate monooxygenase
MERYAAASGVAPRFGASVEEAAFDTVLGAWAVRLAGGEVLMARWLVVATGENAEPHVPDFPGLRQFAGRVLHTCEYKSGEEFAGEKVLVVGCGNSGMEVSLDLCRYGAKPSMVVRNTVISLLLYIDGAVRISVRPAVFLLFVLFCLSRSTA